MDRIRAIDAVTDVPLVIHGGSGVPSEQRARLARDTSICKYNIGIELRMVFGSSLRDVLDSDDSFDRVGLLSQIEDPMAAAARPILRNIGPK